MLYLPKIDDYLKILTDNEVKDFAVINFVEYFNLQEKFYSKLCAEQNIREVVESLYIFLKTPDEVKKYVGMMQSNSSNNCVHHYNIESFESF